MSIEFHRLQEDLNTIEKSVNFVEKANLQQEKISQKLDNVIKKIDELTTNEAGKLEAQEVLTLQQQIERIKLIVGITTTKNLSSLKTTITTGNSILSDRPIEVQKGIQTSEEKIKKIAKGKDKNIVAHRMQQGIERLLS